MRPGNECFRILRVDGVRDVPDSRSDCVAIPACTEGSSVVATIRPSLRNVASTAGGLADLADSALNRDTPLMTTPAGFRLHRRQSRAAGANRQ